MCARSRSAGFLVVLVALCIAPAAAAQRDDEARQSDVTGRWNICLTLPTWPGLTELNPAVGGSFDSMGYGLALAWHTTTRHRDRYDLLVGFDIAVSQTGSSIPTLLDNLVARHLYLGVSTRWLLGRTRSASVDAGIGYHGAEIAEVGSDGNALYEFRNWESKRAGGFIGATWDIGAGRLDKNGGVTLGVKAHFVNFGTVRDESSPLYPTKLGYNAGVLDGPLYVFQVGYWSR